MRNLSTSRYSRETRILAIKINKNIAATRPQVPPPPAKPEEEKKSRGLIRELFQGTVGVANAAYKIPASIVSGAVVGGYQGVRKGLDKDYKADARTSALAHITVSTIQGQLQAGVLGFMIGGVPGAITNMALDSLSAAPGVFVFIKGGSAEETGQRLAESFNSIESGEGAVSGLVKGVGAGVVGSVKAAAVTGFREGKGMAAGLVEGLGSMGQEFKKVQAPKGPFIKAALNSGLGVASGLLSGVSGAVLPLVAGEEKKAPGVLKRVAVAAATGAATGAAIGSFGGPIGMAIGGGVGMLLNLAGPAPREKFAEQVLEATKTQEKNNLDLGSEIANKNEALFESVFVGAAAGTAAGWNFVVASPEAAEKS